MEVSIIIPIYNGARFIHRLVQCLQNQKYKDFEAILVDDGSTDNSLEICQKYTKEDSRFVLLSQQNSGASEARNAGLRIAKGHYICFADVDDVFNEYYIEDLMKNAHCGDLVLQGRVRNFKDKETIISIQHEGIYDLREDPESFFSAIDIEKYGAPYCKLFSNEIIQGNKIFFSTNILLAEDFDFLIRYLSFCNKVVIDNKVNYCYRDNEGSLSTKLYSFEYEYLGLKQIDASWQMLNSRFLSPSLVPIYGKSIAYHVYRSIFGLFKSSLDRKGRVQKMNVLFQEYGAIYEKYRKPETPFLKFLKFLFSAKFFTVFDYIMTKAIRQ